MIYYYRFCRHARKRKVPSNAIQKGDKSSNNQNVISIWPFGHTNFQQTIKCPRASWIYKKSFKIESTVREGKNKSLQKTYQFLLLTKQEVATSKDVDDSEFILTLIVKNVAIVCHITQLRTFQFPFCWTLKFPICWCVKTLTK